MKKEDPSRTIAGNGVNYSLMDTEALYESMKTVLQDNILTINANSTSSVNFDKWNEQIHGYGVERFFGLSEDNEEKVLMLIFTDIQEGINKLF